MLPNSLRYGSTDLSSMMTLKLSSNRRARRKSDFVFAPDLRYSSRIFCWSLGLGILMCHLCPIEGRWHIFRQACSVSSFPRLHYHDFGVIDTPFGARVFVVQMAICGTKIHLASIKKECFIASTDHSVPLALEQS